MVNISQSFLSLVCIAVVAVDASLVGRRTGKPTLSLARVSGRSGALSLVESDRSRLNLLASGCGPHSAPRIDITNPAGYYTAEIGVGKPPTNYTLIVDTGSSITWVGANKTYVPTETSRDTGRSFHVRYGSGNVTGEEWIDTVTLGSDLVVQQQPIGVANAWFSDMQTDGIIGFGPRALTNRTVNGTETVPTVMNNLFSQGGIHEEVLGVYFVPSPVTDKTGELTFGGYDESAIVGPVDYVALTQHKNASRYWGIDQRISYGSDVIMQSGAGVVDTGTTFIYIPSAAFEIYINKTGATYDNATQLFTITQEQYDELEPLVFHIGDVPYELTPNAQIWPRSLNSDIGGTSDTIYLVVLSLGIPNFDFINGFAFLERFYSVYDTTHQAVGFARTQYTYGDIN